jgi:hypothetical protein
MTGPSAPLGVACRLPDDRQVLSNLQKLDYTAGFAEGKPHARASRKARPVLNRGA